MYMNSGSLVHLPFDLYRETINHLTDDFEGLKGLMLTSRLSADKYEYTKKAYETILFKQIFTQERDVRQLYELSKINLSCIAFKRLSNDIAMKRRELDYLGTNHSQLLSVVNKLNQDLQRIEKTVIRKIENLESSKCFIL